MKIANRTCTKHLKILEIIRFDIEFIIPLLFYNKLVDGFKRKI